MDGFRSDASETTRHINSDGLMVTETTITQFEGWDPKRQAAFVRNERRCSMLVRSDEYAKIILDGNNGGSPTDWLLGERKTGEIAQLELDKGGTSWEVKGWRTGGIKLARERGIKKDTPQLIQIIRASSPNARRAAVAELLAETKERIEVALCAKKCSATIPTRPEKEEPNESDSVLGTWTLASGGKRELANVYPGEGAKERRRDATMAKEIRLGPAWVILRGDFLASHSLRRIPSSLGRNRICGYEGGAL